MDETTVKFDEDSIQLWEPADVDRDEWFDCHGMPCAQYKRMQETMRQMLQLEMMVPKKDRGEKGKGPLAEMVKLKIISEIT